MSACMNECWTHEDIMYVGGHLCIHIGMYVCLSPDMLKEMPVYLYIYVNVYM